MGFQTAIATCLSKYATFQGRATRSEFWWFYLFCLLLSWGSIIVGNVGQMGNTVNLIINLALFLPTLAAGTRRLHDIGKSGWWQLLMLTVIGLFPLIYWWAKSSQAEVNSYGEPLPVPAKI